MVRRCLGSCLEGLALNAFPAFSERVQCFAVDWLGRQFAVDRSRPDRDGQPQILMLDVGVGEVLEMPGSLRDFHESELIDYHDAALASSYYSQWRRDSGDTAPLTSTECVGYRIPLFLGGVDDTSNLERSDADVYWSLCGQMLSRRGL
ncbi:DUF1851 domain-containing protein [Nocardioides sp. KIGAM211]|uniref:DUF1851 domain-containing protein n=1 Tax=Nocardioides luti TaxID=2761101 RepID=A0A7X0RF90_9ACTN|nr:T6SS immunity protein Tdi1 domain-containing protein [Nocardioides luti]MBB6626240.1 DUF1851 domain-containing protein [Nocardioides luti]